MTVAEFEAYIAKLKAQIVALGATPVEPGPVVPPPPPPPPPPLPLKTLLGISGASDLAGACERWFSGGGLSNPARRLPKAQCPRMHASWKPLGGPAWNDAQLIVAFRNLLDGDKVEVEHESDAKYRKGEVTQLAQRLALKNKFYADVKRLRETGQIAQLVVVNTMTSYAFQPSQMKVQSPTLYDAKADVLGADLDGGPWGRNYADPKLLGNIVAHAKAHYGGRWTAPEFGWNNTPPGARMATFIKLTPLIAAFKPEEIQLFDSAGFSPVLTKAELAEWQTLCRQYNG